MKTYKLTILVVASALGLVAGSAAAQVTPVLVGLQQRIFEKYGDGSTGPDSVPCCNITPMNPVQTIDARTIGQNMGAYFAEYKNRTAMVGNLFGFGTPAALNGKGPLWYGIYNGATQGVTIKHGRYTTMASLMLIFPGGNLRRLTTVVERTMNDLVMRPNNGPGNFDYLGAGNTADKPTFRAGQPSCPPPPTLPPPGCWAPYGFMAGQLHVVAGPNRFGGTRAVVNDSFATGVDNGAIPGFANRFFLPVANGPGVPITPMSVVRRETRSATFAQVSIPSSMATTGPTVFQGLGTGWFTILPYTTGRVQVIASTIGTPIMDYTHRTDVGSRMLNVTGMGGITGTLQLVSGHLLQSRGGINTNLGGTNMTRITFTPEPASAAMLAAGALGLIGLIVRERRRSGV